MHPKGLSIGHQTILEKNTGLTVFLMDPPATASSWLCGNAPATRDVDLLDPSATVPTIHALVLSGGSAFGLGVANGVMRWLVEKGQGIMTFAGVVPIVPTACIFDLKTNAHYPLEQDGYLACQNATSIWPTMGGKIGAGTGATVAKFAENSVPQESGIGFSSIETEDGLWIGAVALVNALGEIRGWEGESKVVARTQEGSPISFLNTMVHTPTASLAIDMTHQNTTLVAVFTNSKMTKGVLKRVAKMASAGMARAIYPSFSHLDGDIVFAVSLGSAEQTWDELRVGSLAAKQVQEAIYNAFTNPACKS